MGQPLVIHCPNPLRAPDSPWSEAWKTFCGRVLSHEPVRGAAAGPSDLTIVTYNNHGTPGLLERCLAHLGVPNVVVLGQDKTDWRWEYKIALVEDYLRSGACRTEYAMCLDGDDVLVLGHPAVILDRFLRARCEILFCNTMADWPPQPECRSFEESVARGAPRAYRHLSAGGYIGRAEYIRDRLGDIMAGIGRGEPGFLRADGAFSDQLAWRQLHRLHYPAIRIDITGSIFARPDTLPR